VQESLLTTLIVAEVDIAADVVAGLAFALAVVVFFYSWSNDRRVRDAHKEDKAERAREREEDKANIAEEIALLARQVKGEEAGRAARLEVRTEERRDDNLGTSFWDVSLANGGDGTAGQLSAWAGGGEDQEPMRFSGLQLHPPLKSGETREFTLTVPFAGLHRPIRLWLAWADGNGEHTKALATLWDQRRDYSTP
jgi:hypothetical protein